MAQRDPERLRAYLTMITRKRGGIEGTINDLASIERPAATEAAGLESLGDAASDPTALARQGLESLALERTPSDDQYAGLEAIISADLRPAIDIVDGRFTVTHPLWTQLSTDPAIRQRIESVIPSIGRIELSGYPECPYGGTGFVVGEGLIMTNRHVAALFARGLGDRSLAFIDGRGAGIDFRREQGRPTGPTLQVRRVVMIHPYWDMALLAVDGLEPTHQPLPLSLADARDLAGQDIFVIGYPAFDPRNPSTVQHDLFDGRYGVKRLQPGELQGGGSTASFGKVVLAATHDCSTLGGNSGSAVVDLATGHVMALHFGGVYQERNFAVPSAELARDQRVVDGGVQFAGTPGGGIPGWADWWQRADASEATVAVGGPASNQSATTTAACVDAAAPPATPPGSAIPVRLAAGDGTIQIEVPLRITISLGTPVLAPTTTAAIEAVASAAGGPVVVAEEALEAARRVRDTDYASRPGYDPDFFAAAGNGADPARVQVPMPTAADPAVCAPTRTGGSVLDYQNFSIVMHAQRRLALITAANVTREPELRQPEPGRDYSRAGLGGTDSWFPDPRLDGRFQLPDIFFTQDRRSFDKGHVVRREDVAWGRTYDLVRRANADSFHGTNCSPQVPGFNQSSRGTDNWGDLENHVLAEAANERLCMFAGPVLAASDEVFAGVGDGGSTIRAKIPARFWKVIVARVQDGLAAYGFVLEQDLSNVDLEFTVPAAFAPAMYPLADIEAMAGVVFADAIRDADQYETTRGAEVGRRGGARRRRRRRS